MRDQLGLKKHFLSRAGCPFVCCPPVKGKNVVVFVLSASFVDITFVRVEFRVKVWIRVKLGQRINVYVKVFRITFVCLPTFADIVLMTKRKEENCIFAWLPPLKGQRLDSLEMEEIQRLTKGTSN